jgi:hypothetical protein
MPVCSITRVKSAIVFSKVFAVTIKAIAPQHDKASRGSNYCTSLLIAESVILTRRFHHRHVAIAARRPRSGLQSILSITITPYTRAATDES